ncbi:unnamed protein product [Lactuca virosa]|uniref:Uncharacterized protein n=1 Tax=Lactuca virosa TaxID=75947 RepID=A0AAU9LKP4_9ASTR|nr:unnamed protein product [Lactuca virosa]
MNPATHLVAYGGGNDTEWRAGAADKGNRWSWDVVTMKRRYVMSLQTTAALAVGSAALWKEGGVQRSRMNDVMRLVLVFDHDRNGDSEIILVVFGFDSDGDGWKVTNRRRPRRELLLRSSIDATPFPDFPISLCSCR